MADHSLRWLLAVALLDGDVTIATFEPGRLRRADARALIGRMRIREDPALTARWPREWVSVVTVRMRDGRTIRRETPPPVGDPRNPATPMALETKVASLIGAHLGADRARDLVRHVDRMATWPRAGLLFEWPMAAAAGG